jgi:hypothetical protein
MRTDENFKILDWIGKPEQVVRDAARDAGYLTRVIHEDGKNFVCTRDYRTNRLNLSIQGGMVFQISIG